MFRNLIWGILGGLGIITKHIKFKKSEFKDFIKGLPPGTVILSRDRTPGFFGGSIQAITNSAWTHAFIYVGKSLGDILRKKYPHLLLKRHLKINGNEFTFNPISDKAMENEIVESLATVSVRSLKKYDEDDTQMEAWVRALTQQEMETVCLRAYELVGLPYDVLEIGAHVFPFIPNPEKTKVCSSLVTHVYNPVERVVKKNVDLQKASPRNLRDYFVKFVHWSPRRFNC